MTAVLRPATDRIVNNVTLYISGTPIQLIAALHGRYLLLNVAPLASGV